MSAEPSCLEIKDLKKTFSADFLKKNYTAIAQLTCQFTRGRCTGFLGHNGAGKTTTIRAILGLIRPCRGEIFFNGEPMQTHHRKKIGYMAESSKLSLAFTPQEILKYHLKAFAFTGKIKPLVEDKLQEIGLWEHRHKSIRQLSKGLGRRLAWATATIHNPEFIILDEPFSGLDPLGREKITTLIKKLKDQKKTILMCTHELASAASLCEDIYVIQNGVIVYSSKESEEHKDAYFLKTSPQAAIDLQKIGKSIAVTNDSVEIHFSTYQSASQALDLCNKKQWQVECFGKLPRHSQTRLLDFFQDKTH